MFFKIVLYNKLIIREREIVCYSFGIAAVTFLIYIYYKEKERKTL